MRARKLVLAAMLAAVAAGNASECPPANVLADPQVFQWTFHPVTANNPEPYYSGTLEYGEASFTIDGASLTTRAYRQQGFSYSIPGPTLIMEPGKKYVVIFKNLLPYEAPSEQHNALKDPNITNLHTHGLHLSGESPGDDVIRFFEGGFAGDFVYDIPADHMGGTYWYHAHHHGSTFLQVSSGAFGLIVIDDGLDGVPSTVSGMSERPLVVAYLDPSVAGTGGDTLISGTLTPTWTVNGLVGGNLCVPENTWEHWRVLVADSDARTKTLAVGAGCEVALMARDGVWRTEVPKVLTPRSLDLTGASRADLAVRCTVDSELTIDGLAVADIFVDGPADPSVHPWDVDGSSTWSATRPSYLRDLRGLTADNTEIIQMGARTINGDKFDVDVPTFSIPATQLQEWELNGARNHPFHKHIYHVQVVEDCDEYEGGEYYDTVAQNCIIRFDLNAATSSVYQGRTIFHCHILDHEDQGAMGWTDVLGGLPPPTYPNDGDRGVPYQEYYPIGGNPPPAAPTELIARVTGSSEIDLSWIDNAADEDGFELERSTDGVSFGLLATLAADATAYADTTVSSGTGYLYRIHAFNSHGNSADSNTVGLGCEANGPDLELVSLQVTDFLSCYSWGDLSASTGVTVNSSGTLVLDALQAVELGGGFSVESGGELRVLP